MNVRWFHIFAILGMRIILQWLLLFFILIVMIGVSVLVYEDPLTLVLTLVAILGVLIFAALTTTPEKLSDSWKDNLNHEIQHSQNLYQRLQQRWQQYENMHQEKQQILEQSLLHTERSSRNSQESLQTTVQQIEKISQSLEEQSKKIKKMLGSLADMTTAIQSVASHATASVNTSMTSEGHAKKGGEVVNQIIKHMNKITQTVSKSATVIRALDDSSKKIVDIIAVINDIADQTNLLALNAAIEAARAGSQGRGFAVVADQVRSLAEKTTHATKEISETLSSIQEKTSQAVESMAEGLTEIDRGAALAVQAGVSLRRIVTGARQVTEMISMIAEAADKQSQAASLSSSLVKDIDHNMDITCGSGHEYVTQIRHLNEQMQELCQWLENFHSLWTENFQHEEMIVLAETTNKEWLQRNQRIANTQQNLLGNAST